MTPYLNFLFAPEIPDDDAGSKEESDSCGPEDHGIAEVVCNGARADRAGDVAHQEDGRNDAEDDRAFFRRHRFGDDRIRARCDEAHAKARDAAEETKSRDGRHEVLHDEGEADEYRRGDEHPMDDEARRDAAGIERCEGAAAAGNEDNEPDDGRNDGRIPHHRLDIERQDRPDAGDAEVAEELHECHDAHTRNLHEELDLAPCGVRFLRRPFPVDVRQENLEGNKAEESKKRERVERHAVAEGICHSAAKERSEHDAHDHGRLEVSHRPGRLLFRCDRDDDGKTYRDKASDKSLQGAEQQ